VLKHDIWIRNRAEYGMITPFQPELIRRSRVDQELGRAVLSYGCSSYGYDIRLSPMQGMALLLLAQ
jgi:dCTP deaminase